MAVDPRIAVRRALKTYLETQLGGTYTSMKFFDEWPHGQALGALALSVTIPPGDIGLVEFPPAKVKFTIAQQGDATGTLQYSRGRASVNIQLDLWCGFPAVRDELTPVVNAQLNRPPSATLNTTELGALAQAPGLVLALTGFYGTNASINFGQFPSLDESSDVQQEGRFRATWQGTADVHLLNEESVAVMKHLTLKLGVNGGASSDVALF